MRVRVRPHHSGVRGVGQSERSSVVFLVQLRLPGVELIQSAADLAALLQSLSVLWKLGEDGGGWGEDGGRAFRTGPLVPRGIYHKPSASTTSNDSISGAYIAERFLVTLGL